ncbi:MAG TPA: response regulator [Desulfobacterales bacterium]|nr:response regulator [Desulfobacterales bacterium]
MLSVEKRYLDQISEVFYSILKGQKPNAVHLPEDHPDNELRQAVGFINQFIDEYNGISELMYSLSRGDIHFEAPKGRMRVIQSLKSLQATLRNLTWTTQQIAKGEFDHSVNFMGEFSEAFNSMTQQLKTSFQEREKTTQALHDQVGELAKARRAMLNIMEDLEEARKEAESATRSKSDFLANMSHEIRTPMNAVIGMAHLALQTDLTPKQADYVKKIQRSAHSLLGIINDILDFSKIEAGKLQMESVDFSLDEVLDNVSTVVGVKAHEKELEFLMDTPHDLPMALVGDPLRLGQVLINLCNNAVKFTQAGEIVVSTSAVEKGDESVTLQFCVRDTGVGLSEEQKGKLFQAFSQADTSTTRKYGGTGLGLTISKRLVNMMGGEIWVESEPGKGSEFIFTAKFGLARKVARKHLVPSVDLRGMRVLVVDDNASSREILQALLESMSFEVTVAASAEEGIAELQKAAKDRPYKLVVMDWKMPGMDGIKASEVIKRHPSLPQKPKIIIATAYGREEVMQRSEKVGVEGFLLKPVGQSVLFDAIMVAFGKEALGVEAAVRVRGSDEEGLQQIRGARVLLAEDNEINQQVAKEILEQAGLAVHIANNGQEALYLLRTTAFDAVLMDVQMPVMDGYTATRKIRELEAGSSKLKAGYSSASASSLRPPASSLPIIAMTAHAMSGDHEKSIAAGMNDHVTKPIDPEKLIGTLAKWIGPRGRAATSPEAAPASIGSQAKEPAPLEQALPDTLPEFDVAEGLQRLMGNRALYRKLLANFATQYIQAAATIRSALDAGDFEQAHGLVHAIKGVAGNLAAKELQVQSAALEKLVKHVDPSSPPPAAELDRAHAAFRESLGRALDAVRSLIPAAAAPAAPVETPAALSSALAKEAATRLREAAELGDVSGLAAICSELAARSEAFGPYKARVAQLADDFDFDGVLKLTEELEK